MIRKSTIFKIVFTLAVLLGLLSSEYFSLENIHRGLSNLNLLFAFVFIKFFQTVLAGLRNYLLIAFRFPSFVDLRNVFFVTWASQLISSVTPSFIFGEVYKLKELAGYSKETKIDGLLYSSLIIKVLSTLSLGIISLISLVTMYKSHLRLEIPHLIGIFLTAVTTLFIITYLIFANRKKIILLLLNVFTGKDFSYNRVLRLDQYLELLIKNPRVYLTSFVISLLIQALSVICFLFIIMTQETFNNANLLELICVIPIGLLAISLPISIAGLGVGHVAFYKLFLIYGITNGADVFTIYFAFSFIFSAFGVVPFLIKNKGSKHESKIYKYS